jgi:hypothetical protein
MAFTLTYRSRLPVDADLEAAIRKAADTFNQGRAWGLSFTRDQQDGHLVCAMESSDDSGGTCSSGETPRWPGPYEAKCLLESLCSISRDHGVDWEIKATYSSRPVGMIRGGVCQADQEAHAEALRRMGERHDRR